MRSYRYCFWDNGTIVANLLAAATAAGLPARVLMGFVDAQVNHLLGLDGHREASTCLAPLGQPVDLLSLEETDQVPPLSAEIELSSRGDRLPGDCSPAHRLGPDHPGGGRGVARVLTPKPAPSAGPRYPLRPLEPALAAPRALGDVIRQRGSTRRFAREPMSFSQLSALLAHATTGVPADFLGPGGTSLLDIYLISNAVTDLPREAMSLFPKSKR